MITRPLDLQSRLKPPSHRFNTLPLFDILLIALFFSLLSSRFVLSPGLVVNLPQGGGGPGLPASAVLTVRSDDMLLFEGQILSVARLEGVLSEHLSRRGETNLLIYFDREVSMQTLLAVSEIAREAGVARIQLAAEPDEAEAEGASPFH